jgi:glycyl-tRNA synthetase
MGEELEGVAARSDFDLSQHQRFAGKPMTVFDEELKAAWSKLSPEKQTELGERYFQARAKYLTKSRRDRLSQLTNWPAKTRNCWLKAITFRT